MHESLQVFEDMRRGLINEGQATLRCVRACSCPADWDGCMQSICRAILTRCCTDVD